MPPAPILKDNDPPASILETLISAPEPTLVPTLALKILSVTFVIAVDIPPPNGSVDLGYECSVK